MADGIIKVAKVGLYEMAERADEERKEKNAIIEKQALQIVALKRLYKAK